MHHGALRQMRQGKVYLSSLVASHVQGVSVYLKLAEVLARQTGLSVAIFCN